MKQKLHIFQVPGDAISFASRFLTGKKAIEKVKGSNPLAKHSIDAFTKTSNKPQPVVPEVAPMAPSETIAEPLMNDGVGGAMRRKRVMRIKDCGCGCSGGNCK
jgi:hypothetical protein